MKDKEIIKDLINEKIDKYFDANLLIFTTAMGTEKEYYFNKKNEIVSTFINDLTPLINASKDFILKTNIKQSGIYLECNIDLTLYVKNNIYYTKTSYLM